MLKCRSCTRGGKFHQLKKRFMCHIIGIEPQFENIIKNGPFIPMVAGQRKLEGQWTADERKAANLDQCLKSLIICKALMNELVNDSINLSKLEINTGFINGLPKKWLSFCQSLKNTNHVKDFELASLFGKLEYEENLIDSIYETKKNESFVSATPLHTSFFLLPLLSKTFKIVLMMNRIQEAVITSKASMVKNKGLIVEAYEWDEEEVSSDDNEMVEVKVLMDLAEHNDAVNKEGARNGEWVKISMRKYDIRKPICYLDSGCSRHMTGVKSYLYKYVEQSGPKVVFGDDSTCTIEGYGSIKFYIHNHKDHLGKFAEKDEDGYLFGYSLVSKAFRVFNTRKKQTEETYHITFDESPDAIKFSKPSVDNINIAETERYPPDEYLHPYKPSKSDEQIIDNISNTKYIQISKHSSSPSVKDTLVQNTTPIPTPPLPIPSMVTPAPQDRWSQDKHIELVNIIGNPGAGMLTRAMAKQLSAASAHECLFVDFLSEEEPKKVSEALKHLGWVDAMQDELNQFSRNKAWTLVHAPYGKTIIGSKWFSKKRDETGIVIKTRQDLSLEAIISKKTYIMMRPLLQLQGL
ncbi:retrovirus-related pol polyprotein from transposon TNT 1-94 [Tanacetum coccineum]